MEYEIEERRGEMAMTKAQMLAMSDAEVRLRLENVRLRMKIVAMLIRRVDMRKLHSLGNLIRRKNRLLTQEKKWRLELDRREKRQTERMGTYEADFLASLSRQDAEED